MKVLATCVMYSYIMHASVTVRKCVYKAAPPPSPAVLTLSKLLDAGPPAAASTSDGGGGADDGAARGPTEPLRGEEAAAVAVAAPN